MKQFFLRDLKIDPRLETKQPKIEGKKKKWSTAERGGGGAKLEMEYGGGVKGKGGCLDVVIYRLLQEGGKVLSLVK